MRLYLTVLVFSLCMMWLHAHSHASSEPMLRMAVVLTRHGDRTPLRVFPNTLAKWSEGLGILTAVGARQHRQLGAQYRQRYVEEMGLVEGKFYDPDILVRATAKQRTLMSAYSFMSGFFPPTGNEEDTGLLDGYQPVPIYSETLSEDKLLYAYKSCGTIPILRKIEKRRQHWLDMAKEGRHHLEELSDILGEDISVADCSTVWNNLMAEKIHGQPSIPALTNNPELLEFVEEAAAFSLRNKYGTRQMGRLGVGILLEEIAERMKKTLHQVQGPKFILFSAHDGTILTMFSAMGLTDVALPHYAASVSFELYQVGDRVEDAFVRVFYNHEPLPLPGCEMEKCSLSAFNRLVQESTASPEDYIHDRIHEVTHFKEEL